jgi:lysophospholipase L1-like esterase
MPLTALWSKRFLILSAFCLAALSSAIFAQAAKSALPVEADPLTAKQIPPADQPAPRPGKAHFYELHDSFLKRGKAGPIDLLFLGDSITEHWAKAPEVWGKYYGAFHPANFGIGGDATQNVLWRIEQGELDGLSPRVLILLLGTNNTATHTAEEIVAAQKKLLSQIRQKLPKTKVLLLALFPRGPRKNSQGQWEDGVTRMKVIDKINAGLPKLADGRTVRFLNINDKFLDASGKIPDALMPDQLHPGVAGYEVWAQAMQPLLLEMLKE